MMSFMICKRGLLGLSAVSVWNEFPTLRTLPLLPSSGTDDGGRRCTLDVVPYWRGWSP